MLPKSHDTAADPHPPRPGDATLSVAKAARILGVHANTVRAWSDAGRLRYYRINERGDRRYRPADLQRFLAAAASGPAVGQERSAAPRIGSRAGTGGPSLTESPAGFDLLAGLSEIALFPGGLDPALDDACIRIRTATGAALVGVWERRPAGLVPRATAVEGAGILAPRIVPSGRSAFSLALEVEEPVHARPGSVGPAPVLGIGTDELVVSIPGGDGPWGVLALAGAVELGPDDGRRLAQAIARTLGVLVRATEASEQAAARLRRSEALRRISIDLASRLDAGDVVRDLGDHARVLFGADRVAVILRDTDGQISSPGSTGFSETFLQAARNLEDRRVDSGDIPPRRATVLLSPECRAPRAPCGPPPSRTGSQRCWPCRWSTASGCTGCCSWLTISRTAGARWTSTPRRALAGDAAVAVRTARTFSRMAAWAGQLQSIQRLGSRLVRPVRGRPDRPCDRDRAAAADRVPQRPRVSRPRRGRGTGRDARPGGRLLGRDRGSAQPARRTGHHRLGGAPPGAADHR